MNNEGESRARLICPNQPPFPLVNCKSKWLFKIYFPLCTSKYTSPVWLISIFFLIFATELKVLSHNDEFVSVQHFSSISWLLTNPEKFQLLSRTLNWRVRFLWQCQMHFQNSQLHLHLLTSPHQCTVQYEKDWRKEKTIDTSSSFVHQDKKRQLQVQY